MTSRRDFIKTGAFFTAAGLAGAHELLAQRPALPKRSFAGSGSYAANATPRPWTVPQKPSKAIAVDVHTHWAPAAYLKAKADLGQPDFLDASNYDLVRRATLMEERGIQSSILTLGGFRPWVWVTPAQGAMISRVSNDAAIEAHKAYPDRFFAGIELNCSDPTGSLVELNRVAGKPGMVCVHLPTSLAGRDFLFDSAFQPVLARTHELGLPILLHPLDGEANWFGGKRLADAASGVDPNAGAAANRFPGLTNSLGNSLEMAVCISKLITSGTLDRYPALTFIATMGGGALPYVGGRLENRGRYKRPITEYLRRFYYDSLTYWPDSLRFLADMIGSDRILLGTDNMYAGGNQMMDQPLSLVDQANFNDEDRDLIVRGNAKRLFKI